MLVVGVLQADLVHLRLTARMTQIPPNGNEGNALTKVDFYIFLVHLFLSYGDMPELRQQCHFSEARQSRERRPQELHRVSWHSSWPSSPDNTRGLAIRGFTRARWSKRNGSGRLWHWDCHESGQSCNFLWACRRQEIRISIHSRSIAMSL